MKDIKHIRRDFHSVSLGHVCPRVWVLGVLGGGGGGGGSKFNFLNMVMWHIKLQGMSSKPGYTEMF